MSEFICKHIVSRTNVFKVFVLSFKPHDLQYFSSTFTIECNALAVHYTSLVIQGRPW